MVSTLVNTEPAKLRFVFALHHMLHVVVYEKVSSKARSPKLEFRRMKRTEQLLAKSALNNFLCTYYSRTFQRDFLESETPLALLLTRLWWLGKQRVILEGYG